MFRKFFNYVIILCFLTILFASCNLENSTMGSGEELTIENNSADKCYINPHNQDTTSIINQVLIGLQNEKTGQVLRYLTNNIEWTFDGEESEIPFANTYYGKKNIKKGLKKFYAKINITDLIIENQIETEASITSYTRLKGSIPSTRKTFDMEYVFTWVFNSRNKIDKCFITYNTYSLGIALSSKGEGHIISDTTVSPEAQFFYDYYKQNLKEWFKTASPEELRAAEVPFFPSWPSDADVEEVTIAGLECDIVRIPPEMNDDKIIIWFHGGAFIQGDKRLTLMFPYQLVKNTKIPVISVNYRLAPENPFPAAPEDCFAVYQELLNNYEAENIAIIGESTGGNLVMTTALLAQERNVPLPGALLPLSPWFNLTNSGGTYITNQEIESLLSVEFLNNAANHYLNGSSPTNPIVSPIFADIPSNFPPVFLSASTCELLFGDSVQMFEKLTSANIDVTIEILDGLVHAWHTGVGLAPESDRTNIRITQFIKDKLGVQQ